MNRNILFVSLIVSVFFMLLSFLLRIIFFSSYLSLLVNPLIVFFGWLIITFGVLFFFKNDFPELYSFFIFFKEDNKETDEEVRREDEKNAPHRKTFEVVDETEGDYSEIFQNKNISENDKDISKNPSWNIAEDFLSEPKDDVLPGGVKANPDNSDPKKLAMVVKKYLNE